jgi:hypothetical protein
MIGLYYSREATKLTGIQSIDLDATIEEQHEWAAEVTSNPVETGAPVSDHVIEKPDRLRITGLITNSPLHGPLAGQYFGGETQAPRIQTAFEAIYELIKKRETVTAYTKHAIYSDMVIASVNIPRTAGIGEAVEFTMELVHIRLVSTQLVSLPPGISQKKTAKSSDAVAKKTEPQKAAGKSENDKLLAKYPAPASNSQQSILQSLRGK